MSEEKKLLILSSEESLEYIKNKCNQFIDDPDYVYKLCDDVWLIIMKKINIPVAELVDNFVDNSMNGEHENNHDDEKELECINIITITNESRKNIYDPLCAKFRANVLEVHKIINIETMEQSTFLCHEFYNYDIGASIPLLYEVGKVVEPDSFDPDLNNICSNGVHYFKTIDRAFYYRNYDNLPLYTGRCIDWFDNGQKKLEGSYIKGKMNGKWTYWDTKGRISFDEYYSDGIRCGIWTSLYEDGNKAWEKHYYVRAPGVYRYVSWYKNGNIEVEGDYIINNSVTCEDIQHGVWTYWTTSGQKICDKKYVDGIEQNI